MIEPGKDILKNNYFYTHRDLNVKTFQFPKDEIRKWESIYIPILAMDFPPEISFNERKLNEENWKEILPTLKNIKSLSLRHRVDQEFFESICEMENLESLYFWTSTAEDISSLSKLKNLKKLRLDSFSRLRSIKSLKKIENLKVLAIENSFKIDDYEEVGNLIYLEALNLGGNTFAPKNLILESLKPFNQLKELKHLNLSDTSIKDKSYQTILELPELKRLDASWKMKAEIREKIIREHPKLDSGFFVVYDFKKNQFKKDIIWYK